MDSDILLRAKTYPYRIPGRSYLVEADGLASHLASLPMCYGSEFTANAVGEWLAGIKDGYAHFD